MSETNPLAGFLRARREQLSPEAVGLRTGGRRRTPGLRREEVATLAGVSIDYLIRLEQGRDLNPSPSVLAALADALRLDRDERRHLMGLAAHASSPELTSFCPAAPVLGAAAAPTVQLLLDGLDPVPAFVSGPVGDLVAANEAWRTLVAPLGLLEEPNLARFVFLHPDARTVFPDWDDAADAQVALLRAASIQLADEAPFQALLEELQAEPAFAERWACHPVAEKRRGTKRLVHPAAGELRLQFEALGLADEGQRLITWLPADDATAAALEALLREPSPVSPAVLRVVGDG